MSFTLGFKVNPVLRKHGWKPGGFSDWDRDATVKELAFWVNEGFIEHELMPDHYTEEGDIFSFSEDEWRETRKVVESAGCTVKSTLAWRRMVFREPWIPRRTEDLEKISRICELMGINMINIMLAHQLPMAPAESGPKRRIFRSLWDATAGDFEAAAEYCKKYAKRVADFGASITLEIHSDTLTDCPLSTLRMLELIDEPNTGLNPDCFMHEWIYPEYPGGIIPMRFL